MEFDEIPFVDLVEKIIDNRGKTCPVEPSGIPLIATNCVSNDRLYPSYETTRYVSSTTYQSWFRGHPEPGDMLFVTKGSPGRVCWVPDPVDLCIAQDMVAIRANHNLVYPKYLFALLRSSGVQRQIENLHVGTLIPHFKKGDFGKLSLSILRDKAAQREIGNLYFIISEKIDINRQINQTLEQMAQALFQSWFVDFEPVRAKLAAVAEGRDPLRAAMSSLSGKTDAELEAMAREQFDALAATAALFPDEMEPLALGEVPEGWCWIDFGEVITIFDSKRVPLSSRERADRKGDYPYYGATSPMDFIDNYLFDGVYVLMAEDGSVMDNAGKPVTQYVWGQFWVNNHAHVLQGKGAISSENILVFLRDTLVSPYVTGAVQLKINQKNMNSIPFLRAGDKVHEAFSVELSHLFAELRSLSDQTAILVTLRDALLPKLLSGELAVGAASNG